MSRTRQEILDEIISAARTKFCNPKGLNEKGFVQLNNQGKYELLNLFHLVNKNTIILLFDLIFKINKKNELYINVTHYLFENEHFNRRQLMDCLNKLVEFNFIKIIKKNKDDFKIILSPHIVWNSKRIYLNTKSYDDLIV